MKILITGGCGFVGRRFTKRFLDRGDEVTIVDNLVSGLPLDRWMFPPVSTEKLRLLFTDCRGFFNANVREYAPHTFDLIIHLAAIVGGRLKIEYDPLAVATDLSIDAEFFNWVVKRHTDRIPQPKVIYFSSSAAYPVGYQTKHAFYDCDVQGLNETLIDFSADAIGRPDMTYGFAKLAGEYLAQYAASHYDLDVKIYRPFGGYGEDQSFDYPFPSIVQRVLAGNNPVTVWGSGDQRRDFIYIEDVVDAVLATWEHLGSGEALNIGTGIGTSFFDLATTAVELLGRTKHESVINDPTKPEGVYSRVADVTKLGSWYTPTTTLQEGVQKLAKALTTKKE